MWAVFIFMLHAACRCCWEREIFAHLRIHVVFSSTQLWCEHWKWKGAVNFVGNLHENTYDRWLGYPSASVHMCVRSPKTKFFLLLPTSLQRILFFYCLDLKSWDFKNNGMEIKPKHEKQHVRSWFGTKVNNKTNSPTINEIPCCSQECAVLQSSGPLEHSVHFDAAEKRNVMEKKSREYYVTNPLHGLVQRVASIDIDKATVLLRTDKLLP